MRTTLKSRKLSLDEEAMLALEKILAMLQKEGDSQLKLSPSKVGSWLIQCFYEKYFDKEKQRMLEAHLNRKATLIALIKGLESQEDVGRLDAMIKLCKAKGERNGPTKTNDTKREIVPEVPSPLTVT